MKKVVCMLLAVLIVLSLAGCGSSDVKAAEKAIEEIGQVGAGSGEKIAAAREAYDRLPEKDRDKITNADVLTRAEADYGIRTAEDAIGSLSGGPLSKEKVEQALEAYYRLDSELRAKVSNGAALEDAQEVIRTIDAIASVKEIGPDSRESIERVQALYDALDPELRDQVANSGRLEDVLQILEAVEAIELIPLTPPYVKEDVGRAQELYDALGPELQAEVSNYSRLESAQEYNKQLDLKDEQHKNEIYLKACEHYDSYEMEEALEYFLQLPEDYKDTAGRISSAEGYLTWSKARTEVQGKWVWDGQYAAGSNGTKYAADFKSLTITGIEDPEEYPELTLREKRLFYTQVDIEKPDAAKFKDTVLYPLPDLRKDSFTAKNCTNNYNSLYVNCEAGNGNRLALYSSWNAKSGVWDQLLSVHIYLQDDGRLRVECYVTVFEGDADTHANPMFNDHLIFYYDKAQ